MANVIGILFGILMFCFTATYGLVAALFLGAVLATLFGLVLAVIGIINKYS